MSKFKEYYANPEFKERYLAYKNERIKCRKCGKIVSRNNYSVHLKSKFHNNNLITNPEILKLERQRAIIEKDYDNKIKKVLRIKKYKLRKI